MRGTLIRSASFLAFPCQIHKEAATEMLFSNPCKKKHQGGLALEEGLQQGCGPVPWQPYSSRVLHLFHLCYWEGSVVRVTRTADK